MPTLLDDQDQRKATPSDDDAFSKIVGDNWSADEQAKLKAEADAHKAATADELKDAETSGGNSLYNPGDVAGKAGLADQESGNNGGGLLKKSSGEKQSRRKQFISKVSTSMKNHKLGWAIGGLAGVGLVTIIALVLLLLSSLLIPHFMAAK